MQDPPLSPTLVLAGSSLLWGLTWWPLKKLHQLGVEGIPLIWVGYSAVALAFLPYLIKTRSVWMRHPRIVAAIVLFGGIANVSFAGALVYGNVVRVMVLFYLLPLWGVLGGRFLLGETIDRVRALAMFSALAGAILVLGGPEIFRTPPSWIDLVATLSGFAFAMNNICFRASQALEVPIKVGAMFVGCSLVSTALIGLEIQSIPTDVPFATWSMVIAFGFGILLATSGTQWGVNHMEAGRSSIIMILELLGAAVSSAIILGTRLSPQELLGGLLIIGASLLEARGGQSEPVVDQPAE